MGKGVQGNDAEGTPTMTRIYHNIPPACLAADLAAIVSRRGVTLYQGGLKDGN